MSFLDEIAKMEAILKMRDDNLETNSEVVGEDNLETASEVVGEDHLETDYEVVAEDNFERDPQVVCEDKLEKDSQVVGEDNEESNFHQAENSEDETTRQESREFVSLADSCTTTQENTTVYENRTEYETDSSESGPKSEEVEMITTERRLVAVASESAIHQNQEFDVQDSACQTKGAEKVEWYKNRLKSVKQEKRMLMQNLNESMSYKNYMQDEIVKAHSVLCNCRKDSNQKDIKIQTLSSTINVCRAEIQNLLQQGVSSEEDRNEQNLKLLKMDEGIDSLRNELKLREEEVDLLKGHYIKELEMNYQEMRSLKTDLSYADKYRNSNLLSNTGNVDCMCADVGEQMMSEGRNLRDDYMTQLNSVTEENQQLKTDMNEYIAQNRTLANINEELNCNTDKLIAEATLELQSAFDKLQLENRKLVNRNWILRQSSTIIGKSNHNSRRRSEECTSKSDESVSTDTAKNNEYRDMMDVVKLDADINSLIDVFYDFKSFAYKEFVDLLDENVQLESNYNILCEKLVEYQSIHTDYMEAHAKVEDILQFTLEKCQSLTTMNIKLQKKVESQNPQVHANELTNDQIMFENYVKELSEKIYNMLPTRIMSNENQQQPEERDVIIKQLTVNLVQASENEIRKKASLISVGVGTEENHDSYGTQRISDHASDLISDEDVDDETELNEYTLDPNEAEELMSLEILALQKRLRAQVNKSELLENIVSDCKNECTEIALKAKSDEVLYGAEIEKLQIEYSSLQTMYEKCLEDNEELQEQLKANLEQSSLHCKTNKDNVLKESAKYKHVINNMHAFIDAIYNNVYSNYESLMQSMDKDENKLQQVQGMMYECKLLKKQVNEMQKVNENIELALVQNANINELMNLSLSRMHREIQEFKQKEGEADLDVQLASMQKKEDEGNDLRMTAGTTDFLRRMDAIQPYNESEEIKIKQRTQSKDASESKPCYPPVDMSMPSTSGTNFFLSLNPSVHRLSNDVSSHNRSMVNELCDYPLHNSQPNTSAPSSSMLIDDNEPKTSKSSSSIETSSSKRSTNFKTYDGKGKGKGKGKSRSSRP